MSQLIPGVALVCPTSSVSIAGISPTWRAGISILGLEETGVGTRHPEYVLLAIFHLIPESLCHLHLLGNRMEFRPTTQESRLVLGSSAPQVLVTLPSTMAWIILLATAVWSPSPKKDTHTHLAVHVRTDLLHHNLEWEDRALTPDVQLMALTLAGKSWPHPGCGLWARGFVKE